MPTADWIWLPRRQVWRDTSTGEELTDAQYQQRRYGRAQTPGSPTGQTGTYQTLVNAGVPPEQARIGAGIGGPFTPEQIEASRQYYENMASEGRSEGVRNIAAFTAVALGAGALGGGGGVSGGAPGGFGAAGINPVSLAGGGESLIASLGGAGAAGGGLAGAGAAGGGLATWGPIAGSIASSILGAYGAREAAGEQAEANQAAIAQQQDQFNTILDLTRPQREVGEQSLNAIASLLGLPGSEGGFEGFDAGSALENLPGNEVIVDDVMRRIKQSAPTTGGNVLQALADRVGAFQSDRLYNSLFQLAGFGPQASSTAAAGAQSTGNAISSLLQNTGAANASGVLGGVGSVNAGVQNVLQMLTLRDLLGRGGVTPSNALFSRGA